jgi:hypothetical protein
MTLVVGRIIQGMLRVDSDSKITDPNIVSNRNSIFTGVLKTVILNPRISISYAGGVETAQKAIEKIYEMNSFDINSVKATLLNINKESDFDTDFLIASLENQALLYKVSNGKIDVSDQSHWIGDIEGFNMFQKEFVPSLTSLDPKHISEMHSRAFEAVVKSGKIESIGGFHITVHTTKKGLEYLMKMSISMGQSSTITLTNNQSLPMPFGDASTGAFSNSYLISSDPFNPAIGIYFPMGNFGTLYYPKLKRTIIFFKNVSAIEFTKNVKELYKIDLTGVIKDGDYMKMI